MPKINVPNKGKYLFISEKHKSAIFLRFIKINIIICWTKFTIVLVFTTEKKINIIV
jgi:hypothetical protein